MFASLITCNVSGLFLGLGEELRRENDNRPLLKWLKFELNHRL